MLVTLLLASFLLAAFIRRTGTELLADARAAERRQLRAEAYSALESLIAILAVERAENGAWHQADPRWLSLLEAGVYAPAAGRALEVGLVDESAKISLARADAVTLQTALEGAGVMPAEAERMAVVLRDWIRPGQADEPPVAEAPDYAGEDPAYRPARRALRSWGELAAVQLDRPVFFAEDGSPTAALRVFRDDFSLHAFNLTNLNTAPASVLLTLGLGAAEVTALAQHRARPLGPDAPAYFRSVAEAGAVIGEAADATRFGAEVAAWRIGITIRQGAIAFRLMAVVAAPGAAAAPERAAAAESAEAGAAPPVERKRLDYPLAVLEIREDPDASEMPAPLL
ncbi:MAG: general secretion pathway protein GspK [Opitutaceae bacterium]|nr:general secretion pathway protein GspK [Opitutaceae bacterium]